MKRNLNHQESYSAAGHTHQKPTFSSKQQLRADQPIFQTHIHNHIPSSLQPDWNTCNIRVKESREQRAKRMQDERARKQLHIRLISISVTIVLTLLTHYYWPTKSQLHTLRSTKIPLATVVAFLALLKFIKGILCQYNYGLSKIHSCKKVFKIFMIILLAVLVL